MTFSSAFSHASGGRHRLGLAFLFSILASACFNDPNIDPTQTRHCKDDKSCPWGSVCGANGICCASADGKTCKALPPSGGLDATALDSSPVYDVAIREAGTGGAPGLDVSIDTGTDLPLLGPEAGTGGIPGTGGTGVIDAPGTDTVDAPLTGTGGIPGTGGAGGTGGKTGTGGSGGSAGGAPGSGGLSTSGGANGGTVTTGGTTGSGGSTFSGCLIAGNQYNSGAVNSANPCQACQPKSSASSWRNNDGSVCDDGVYCNGADVCGGGTCSQHAGSPCPDDGIFCNGTESCDESNRRCKSSGTPCPDDGIVCNGPESCNESTKQCIHGGFSNDCGTWVCGASPSGCFACGACAASQACSQGRCGCTPVVGTDSADSAPPRPAGLKVICLVSPDQTTVATQCPIITCGSRTYWIFSPTDNTNSMSIVGYDSNQAVVYQSSQTGARYIYQIKVDGAAQTVMLVGQYSASIVVPWIDLWQ